MHDIRGVQVLRSQSDSDHIDFNRQSDHRFQECRLHHSAAHADRTFIILALHQYDLKQDCSALVILKPSLRDENVQAKDKKKGGIFEAPVYRVKKRTGLNYVTSFPLRTDEPPSKWILRGVALLCSTD